MFSKEIFTAFKEQNLQSYQKIDKDNRNKRKHWFNEEKDVEGAGSSSRVNEERNAVIRLVDQA